MTSRARKKRDSEFSRRKRRISVVRQPDEERHDEAAGDHEHVGPEHQPHHATVPGLPGWKTGCGVEWFVTGYAGRREDALLPFSFLPSLSAWPGVAAGRRRSTPRH